MDEFNVDDIIANGRRVQEFLRSETGKYLLDRYKEEKESLISEFKNCNLSESPHMPSIIQNKLNILDKAFEWMNDALLAAEAVLQGERN